MAGLLTKPASWLIGTLFGEGSLTRMIDAQRLDRFVSQRGASAAPTSEVRSRPPHDLRTWTAYTRTGVPLSARCIS
jgi:hypothetical protein